MRQLSYDYYYIIIRIASRHKVFFTNICLISIIYIWLLRYIRVIRLDIIKMGGGLDIFNIEILYVVKLYNVYIKDNMHLYGFVEFLRFHLKPRTYKCGPPQ